MNTPLTHREIEELLGVYALDAVEPDERDLVEAHLAGCPRCASEVEGYRETAALLAAHGGGRAPEGVWTKIAGAIEGQEDLPPRFEELAPILPMPTGAARQARQARSLPMRAVALVAGVAAVLAGLLGVGIGRSSDSGDKVALATDLQRVLDDPASEDVWLDADGKRQARVIRGADGTGFIMADQLPALPEDRTYQLWAVRADAKISLGVLGHDPGTTAFKMVGPVLGYAITDEQAPGVGQSGNPPVAVGLLAPRPA